MNNQGIDQALKSIANFNKNNSKLISVKNALKQNYFYTKIDVVNEFVDNLFQLLSKLFVRRKLSFKIN